MKDPQIVLHQWEISPFCRKAAFMLAHKGLTYRTVNYNGLRASLVGKLSGAGKLPVLDVDGERVQDSTRIARFLDERFPSRPLYPAEPLERAEAELWEDWADESLYWFEMHFRFRYPESLDFATRLLCEGRSGFERILVKRIAGARHARKLKAQGLGKMDRAWVEAEFHRHLARIELVLSRREWLVGTEKCIADIAVAAQLMEVARTHSIRSEIMARKRLAAWLERVAEKRAGAMS